MYDWANSAYSTIYITVLVLYLQGAVLKGDAGLDRLGLGHRHHHLCSAILVADPGRHCRRPRQQAGLAGDHHDAGAGASALMFFGTPEHPWFFVAMFLIANLNYELVQSFYNAFLPEIADDKTMS